MPPRLSNDDRRRLLQLARAAVTEIVLHNRILPLPDSDGPLAERAGAFVTLFRAGRLRGCIGLPLADLTLGEAVIQAALGAARGDPRFQPVSGVELHEIEIEISVLSPARPIDASQIEVGKHGLLVTRGTHRGLLLPQVAVERAWTAQVFLEEVCRKAALPAEAWKDTATELLAFTAEVFSEREFPETGLAAPSERGQSWKNS